MPTELPPQYDPHAVESRIYQAWRDAGAFHAVPENGPPESWKRRRYSIVIPPPNVTGALHLGHAINGTIQDILTRYHRMKGDNTLWMPGIDHAGIATQAVVEKTIFETEKKSRHDLGREELVRRIWEWKEKFGTRILTQLQSIGASCDWDRTRFTLDDVCAKAVREAFFKMFKDGLIFRGKRLVNWDTHLQTAVADDEIYHETVKGQMTSIRYPVADDETRNSKLETRNFLVVATTRPETMLGDTAVAVHPDDPRYRHLIGGHVIVPLVGRRIPIIADGQLVDPTFGTGVVKVTPAHDPNDYATGLRHNLEQINLITPDGRVNENGAGEFLGKKYSYTGLKFATAARKKVLEDLETLNLIADKKPHEHEVGHSDRSKTPIEPYLSDQWFVRMGDITEAPKPEPHQSEPRPLGSDPAASDAEKSLPYGRGSDLPAHSTALAYFITYHTYATWLHGEEPGSVDPEHNIPGTPFIAPDPNLFQMKFAKASQPPFELSIPQRQSVLNTLREVAAHRGWTLHAANVRSTHVHAVVSGVHSPERMMNDFKSYATRRLTEAGLIAADTKIWARHGSTPYLWKTEDVAAAVDYVLNRQGENAPGTFAAPSEPRPSGSDQSTPHADRSLPDGRGSDDPGSDGVVLGDGSRAAGLAQVAIDAVADGRVKITPERYAKGYTDWLSQKRDWCISRQLWWGHRIPVWVFLWNGPIATSPSDSQQVRLALPFLTEEQNQQLAVQVIRPGTATGEILIGITVRPGFPEIERALELHNGEQDPDVLDTWFSSALWPLSTLGWPHAESPKSEPRPSGSDRSAMHAQGSLPHGRGSDGRGSESPATGNARVSDGMAPEPTLLPYFYPTSVLSTGRDILTLWVARMVMFGLYCGGDVPFKQVYIHTTIQDGEGRPMKKTLGNGLDPVEVVASHGADAMRFTLASMSTETQDVRMPLVKDPKTGQNTSPKFDLGRNFANKIWNASRFVLSKISPEALEETHRKAQPVAGSPVEDRWIVSRLHRAIHAADESIARYRFAELAQTLYQFFWSDFCDWYLEIAKARIKSADPTALGILLHCLETSLALLHPVMPFITEAIWENLPARNQMLIVSSWPRFDETRFDPSAERQIALAQETISAIREIQNRYPAAKGKAVKLRPADEAVQHLIERSRSIIESLTGSPIVENSPHIVTPKDAATAFPLSVQVFIEGVIDKTAETTKLTKRKAELEKLILASQNKLGNEAFTSKAPAHIIQGLRDQLAKLETEYAALEKNLEELQ